VGLDLSEAHLIRGDARQLPLADDTVDLIITSPPYFALRKYRDGEEAYAGQLGSESRPADFVDALLECTLEMKRVLKPSGSIFVNLGDKMTSSGGHNNSGISKSTLKGNGHRGGGPKMVETRRQAPDSYNKSTDVGGAWLRSKSLMGLPWRYAIGCTDQLELILRAEIVWEKPNGIPESVNDRVRRNHETWFHLTKAEKYFAAIAEIAEPTTAGWKGSSFKGRGTRPDGNDAGAREEEGGTKRPPSVWRVATEPLRIPQWARDAHLLPDHFAAFPTEWPRRLILGWCPSGICLECDTGRFPITERHKVVASGDGRHRPGATQVAEGAEERGYKLDSKWDVAERIVGYGCACTPFDEVPIDDDEAAREELEEWQAEVDGGADYVSDEERPKIRRRKVYRLEGWTPAPTRPAVVLDPFVGTGTVPMVARALGRTGIGVDLSADYLRLARWRIHESGHGAKAISRTALERQERLV
jgi:hypothetical protein